MSKNIDVVEVNQGCWLEEIGQWLENVDRAPQVLASGKPLLQKDSAKSKPITTLKMAANAFN